MTVYFELALREAGDITPPNARYMRYSYIMSQGSHAGVGTASALVSEDLFAVSPVCSAGLVVGFGLHFGLMIPT